MLWFDAPVKMFQYYLVLLKVMKNEYANLERYVSILLSSIKRQTHTKEVFGIRVFQYYLVLLKATRNITDMMKRQCFNTT